MFETVEPAPPDKILSLIGLFRDDPRPGKIDLGIGVYRDAQGRTPIMRAVREAERRLYDSEQTKSYLGPGGDPAYCEAVTDVVFGNASPRERICAVQTPGGAGALRILAGLIARVRPDATVWIPDVTWVNHASILADAGIASREYVYYDPVANAVRLDAMLSSLRGAAPGDVVLLHGCCHNPTGASLASADWDEVCELLLARGLVPFVDLAYQGFGDGLDEDAYAVRLFAQRLPEMLLATSNCKNFGIYRERTGCAFVMAGTGTQAANVLGHLLTCARVAYSMPPDHGASIVRIVLGDPALRADWRSELDSMRNRIAGLRVALAAALAARTGSDRYDFLVRHRGMFSLIGVTPAQAERLRSEHGVYVVSDGRINVAGLTEAQIEPFVAALTALQ